MANSQGPAKSQVPTDFVQVAAVTPHDATEPAVSNDAARSAQQDIAAAEAVSEQTPAMEIKAAESNPKPVAAGPKTSNLYVEVGSFKDETWATAAVDKLTHLGYHAIVIHKNMLWSQSYHVEVGPYPDSTDIVAARQSLGAQGFKLGAVTSTNP
jgi:cell division protein FtsN